MTAFAATHVSTRPTERAPDGSDVRPLLALERGSMAQFQLAPGRTSCAVAHRTVEEIWYVVRGHGEMWRSRDGHEETVALVPGTCLALTVGTRFQFRVGHGEPLEVIGVTMPPWPGAGEAMVVTGPWPAR